MDYASRVIRVCEVDFAGPLGWEICSQVGPGFPSHAAVRAILPGARASFWAHRGVRESDIIWSIDGQFPGEDATEVSPQW